MDTTSLEYNASSIQQTEASGRSIFWALATLAASNMLQPSLSGYLLSGSVFEGSVWPHRSSPVFCAVDAVADVWLIFTRHGRQRGDEQIELATSTTVVMRLAVVFLGVLPQAVKLFSIRGVLATQGLAVLYLVSFIAGISRTLHLEVPHEDVAELAKDMSYALQPSAKPSIKAKLQLLMYPTWALHAGLLIFVWRCIAERTNFAVSEDVHNAFEWLLVGGTFLCALYATQHIAAVLVRGQNGWILPRWPVPGLAISAQLPSLIQIFEDAQTRKSKNRSLWNLTAALMIQATMCCWTIAYVLELFARKLISNPCRRTLIRSGEPATTGVELSDMGLADSEVNVSPSESNLQHAADDSADAELETHVGQRETVPAATISTFLETVNPNASSTVSDDLSARSPTAPTLIHSDSSSSQDEIGIVMKLIAYPFIGLLLILKYANIFDIVDTIKEANPEQSAAERGEIRRTQDGQEPHEETHPGQENVLTRYMFSISQILNKACKLLTRVIVLMIWRLLLGFVGLFGYSLSWLLHKTSAHAASTRWVAFGILNFTSAMLYYMVVFDTAATYLDEFDPLH